MSEKRKKEVRSLSDRQVVVYFNRQLRKGMHPVKDPEPRMELVEAVKVKIASGVYRTLPIEMGNGMDGLMRDVFGEA